MIKVCKKCGCTELVMKERTGKELFEKNAVVGLYCSKCGFWHKWLTSEERKLYIVDKQENNQDNNKEIVLQIFTKIANYLNDYIYVNENTEEAVAVIKFEELNQKMKQIAKEYGVEV